MPFPKIVITIKNERYIPLIVQTILRIILVCWRDPSSALGDPASTLSDSFSARSDPGCDVFFSDRQWAPRITRGAHRPPTGPILMPISFGSNRMGKSLDNSRRAALLRRQVTTLCSSLPPTEPVTRLLSQWPRCG